MSLFSLRLVLPVALFWCLLATPAAAGSHSHTGNHRTSKAPEQVIEILVDYPNTCEEGCRYSRPNLEEIRRLSVGSSPTHWYTWSVIKNPLRKVKFFTEVTLSTSTGVHVLTSRQLDADDEALVVRLEEKTGLEHTPAFDTAVTVMTVTADEAGTDVRQSVHLTSSGMLALWPAKILRSIQESMAAVFANIGP